MTRFSAPVVLALLALAACGPTRSSKAIWQARAAIQRATKVQAAKPMPYELALAREYYVKAKEEAGYSHFELAELLAQKAIVYAKTAAGEAVPTPTPAEVEEEKLR